MNRRSARRRWPAPASPSTATRPPRRWASTGRRRTAWTPFPTATSSSITFTPRRSCSVHLSRLAEEIVLWASQPFGFVRLPDAWSTGSSIMPNKRNPDAAELVRGHSARIVGDLVALLVLLKGLPLAYAKDLQDDKPPLVRRPRFADAEPRRHGRHDRRSGVRARRMRAAAAAGHATATELADWLAGEGVPFREAHHIAGRAVAVAEAEGQGAGRTQPRTSCRPSTRASARRRWSGCRSSPRSPRGDRLAGRRRTG